MAAKCGQQLRVSSSMRSWTECLLGTERFTNTDRRELCFP